MTDEDCRLMVYNEFCKVFGNTQISRATNLGNSIAQTGWTNHNQIDSMGGRILTKGQILHAIQVAKKKKDSSSVMDVLDEIRSNHPSREEEAQWDKRRMKQCLDLLQSAMDICTIRDDLPSNMHQLIVAGAAKAATFEKIFKFQEKRKKDARKANHSPSSEVVEEVSHLKYEGFELDSIEALARHYHGSPELSELEMNISICKIYADVLTKAYNLSSAIQSLKNAWHNKSHQRMIRKAKLTKFLSNAKHEYDVYKNNDHVRETWKKLNRRDLAKYTYDQMIYNASLRKQETEALLATIPKYGWALISDEYNPDMDYWLDTTRREESSYNMPIYNYNEYSAIKTIQKYARHYLRAYHERMRRKEEKKLRLIAETEAAWAASLEQSKRAVKFTVNFGSQNVEQLALDDGADTTQSDVNLEQMLPKKLQLFTPKILVGKWIFYLMSIDDYSLVTIIRNYGTGKVDVRNKKGEKFEKVSASKLFESPLTVGDHVEVRYHKQIDFYKGRITGIHDGHDGQPRYTVKYDDGDVESNVTEDLIRLSSESVADFFKKRKAFFFNKERENARRLHFRIMKEGRASRQRAVIIESARNFTHYWTFLQGRPPTKAGLKSSEGSRAGVDSVGLLSPGVRGGVNSPEVSKPSTRAGLGSADVGISSRKKPTASSEGKRPQDHPQQQGVPPLIGLLQEAGTMRQFESTIQVSLAYTRRILRHGWSTTKINENYVYINSDSKAITHDPPFLTPLEEYYAKKIQTAWVVMKARKYCKRMIRQICLGEVLKDAIDKAKQMSFIGFKYEGADVYMMLRRAGRYELADVIEKHMNKKEIVNKSYKAMSIEDIASFDPMLCEQIGVRELNDKTSLRQFQAWWTQVDNVEKDKALSFINYFDGHKDTRKIQKCIEDSYETVSDYILKYVKGGQARTQMVVKKLLADSIYPLTYAQLRVYIKKYNDNPDDIRNNILELQNKPTTHTYVEERKAYIILKGICRRACMLLSSYKLNRLLGILEQALSDAKSIMDGNAKERNRSKCTGYEAKAAFAIRTALEHVITWDKAASFVQRRTRCYLQRKHYTKLRDTRLFAVTSFQRIFRASKVRKTAAELRAQQGAYWEQLWDNRRNLLYYHNRITKETTYDEPRESIRPLVRDRLSSALIQAWPQLDQNNVTVTETGAVLKPSSPGGPTTFSTTCVECKVRKCVRFCLDCSVSGRMSVTPGTSITPYCFPCFNRIHDESISMKDHRYNDTNQGSDFYLKCCMCEEAATRKCMGVLDEDQINSICNELQWATPDMWFKILQRTNVIGDKKLEMLLNRLKNVSEENSSPAKRAIVGNAQLLEIKSILERTRAECDECYCDSCYVYQHAGGRRTAHRWTGFSKYALVCSICKSSPAESECLDCNNSVYCGSCFKVFHNKGRKKKHRSNIIIEEMNPADEPCELCKRRAATRKCENFECGFHGCDCCYECQHIRVCVPVINQIEEEQENDYLCSVCGELADSKCARCGDFYCTKNYGCFYSMHSRGHRQNHKLVSLIENISVKNENDF